MALDVRAFPKNLGELVAVLVVEFCALGGYARVVQRYAGIVGVVLLLEKEVLLALD